MATDQTQELLCHVRTKLLTFVLALLENDSNIYMNWNATPAQLVKY